MRHRSLFLAAALAAMVLVPASAEPDMQAIRQEQCQRPKPLRELIKASGENSGWFERWWRWCGKRESGQFTFNEFGPED